MTSSAPQFELVIEDIHAALGEIVRALGGNEIVGKRLFPERSAHDAARFVRDATNADRRERFNPEQVWLLFVWARQAGFHGAKRWLDESTGYLPSEPMEPEDERARLQRQTIDAIASLTKLTERLERLDAMRPLAMRAVR